MSLSNVIPRHWQRPLGIGARVLAAMVGGYLLAYASTAALSVHLPLTRPDRVVFASLFSFAVWTLAALYAFGARSALRAWLLIGGLSAVLLLAGLLAGEYGVRP